MQAVMLRTGVVAGAFLAAGAARADIIAANNIADDWSPSSFRGDIGYSSPPQFPNTAEAQYFLSSATGMVTTITAPIRRGFNGPTGAVLRVAIHTANGALGASVPGTMLGFLEFPPDPFPPFSTVQLVTLNFAGAGVTIEAGHAYHLVLTTAVPVPGGSQYSTAWLNPSPLNFGQGPNFSPNAGATWNAPLSFPNELGVRISVQPVPGPAGLAAASVLGLLRLRRRRGNRADAGSRRSHP